MAVILTSIFLMMFQSTLAFSRYTRQLQSLQVITSLATPSSLICHQRHAIGRLCRSSFSSTKVPVEVSPSDHGTLPLKDFASSILDKRITDTLKSPNMNITAPTPIQAHSLPLLFERHDIMASSATGSGKTLMFGLPLLNKLLTIGKSIPPNKSNTGSPSALIISPTRELAVQTANVLNNFDCGISISLATGGSDTRQQRQSLSNCNILVGTPGRICQFLDERKLSLQSIDYLVIDEADRLLDMGFEKDLTRIARSFSRNSRRQSVLCSATFPLGVQRLAADFLNQNYYFVSAGKVGSTQSLIKQQFEWVDIYAKGKQNPKVTAVINNVERFWADANLKMDQTSVIVFCNRKDDAELVGKAISNKLGGKRRQVRVIHGDKPQSERNKAMEDFKAQKVSLLVATDVAARGLDLSSIGLVIQSDPPRDIDTYTHRCGRTGRAGRSGEAVTLLDAKSGRLASGLVDLLTEAGQSDSIPSWLRGQAHINQARSLEEDMKINAGSLATQVDSGSDDDVHNEEFSQQDFRRTAAEGSYGVGKDTSYRSFEDDAYSDDLDVDMSDIVSDENFDIDEQNLADDQSPVEDDLVTSERIPPSEELLRAIADINGSTISDMPDKAVLNALSRSSQKLRFEYIGLFPFQDISPLLMTSSSKDSKDDRIKILMVAEKPSIAKAIADSLSGKRGANQRRGISRALPVYEFTTDRFAPVNGQRCLVRVTSVVGHIYSLGFDFDSQNNKDQRTDPRDYFTLPVTKKEESTTSKLRVVDHLKALAGDSSHLVLWLDCDAEGENIAHEVIAVCRRAIFSKASSLGDDATRVHRAKFSAITPKALQDSFSSLEEPDPHLSKSVDARQELDLRIGVALTRLLTWKCVGIARQRFSSSTRMISYGPCQTPALSFCVDRLREIESFVPERYWKIDLQAKLPDGNSYSLKWRVPTDDAVIDTRSKRGDGNEEGATFSHQSARELIERAKCADMIVKQVTQTSQSILPPNGLNTVALLEAGSKAMGMSPKTVMSVAEKLYSAGFISYPRTETTRYDPNGFDARSLLREHCSSAEWGKSASYLLRTRKTSKPPNRGKDCGDHPPITPLKAANRGNVGGGAAWRVYEYVVRNFLGSLHNDLQITRTKALLALSDSDEAEFEIELVTVDSLGFADACRWVLRDVGAVQGKVDKDLLQEGQRLKLVKAGIEEKKTMPPRFLQEHELIRLMDTNRIGTDASMAVHVSNIVDRGYVMLVDETGVALRPPRPPSQRKNNLPRQIGRYMVPTPLGSNLLKLFGHEEDATEIESPALLSHPSIRRQMEQEVKEIAMENIEKDFCLEKNLDWFEKRYTELERSLTYERVGKFGQGLRSSNDYLRYLAKLGAFEPKINTPNKGKQTKQTQQKKHNGTKKRQNYNHKSKKGNMKGRTKNKAHRAPTKPF